jgi:ADP-ribosylglycohydrolase
MIGAMAGDVIGSVYERENVKTPDFEPLFHEYSRPTDDTVLTAAVAEWILDGAEDGDLVDKLKKYCLRYPQAGYGKTFIGWAMSSDRSPYNSWGNGSAMRVSPVGFAYDTLDEVLRHAERSAAVTHDHPEGIKGAQATATAIFLARTGSGKDDIRKYVESTFGYNLGESIDSIREWYKFDVSCQGSVPQAIRAFLESDGFEDAVRKAISIGGDSDTIACVAGGIAQAFYGGVPDDIRAGTWVRLDGPLREVVREFERRFGVKRSSRGA